MINTEWIKREEQKYFKMGYDAGVLETQLDNARKAPAQTEQVPAVFYRCMSKTEALKLALETLEKLARLGNGDTYGNSIGNVIAHAAIQQIEREPDDSDMNQVHDANAQAKYKTWKPEQEPVAWLKVVNDWSCMSVLAIAYPNEPKAKPVYTSPPKREWVGLTDEQVAEIERMSTTRSQAIRAIDAKLKELNHEV